MKGHNALLAGASGLVGGECLRALIVEPGYERIVVLTRRDLGPVVHHAKVEQVVMDFADLDQASDTLRADHVFCALGTTIRKAGSQEKFREVDQHYPCRLGEILRRNGAHHYSVVSALGAHPAAPFFYSRVKGQMEEALRRMAWPSLAIFRPSLIDGDRGESRPLERLAGYALRIAPATWRPVAAREIAAAMISTALRSPAGVTIIESRNIRAAAQSKEYRDKHGSRGTDNMRTLASGKARWIAAALMAAAAAGCASSGTQGNADGMPSAETDGLVARKVKGLDTVYVRPGVSFKSYQTVQLDPLKVEFDKNWDPNAGRRDLNDMITAEDLQKMKDKMAVEFHAVFVEELTAAGFQVVDQSSTAGTMHLSPAVVDVIVNAPDPMHKPARTRTYTREAGEMTLQLEARDGPTNQVIARVTDEYIGHDTGELELTNSVTNMADFRNAVRAWARQLRSGMKVADVARG